MTHPDKDRSEGATKRFQELSSAYKCLESHFGRLANPGIYYPDESDEYRGSDDLQFFTYVKDLDNGSRYLRAS